MTASNLFSILIVLALGWLFIRQINILAGMNLYRRIPMTAAMLCVFLLTQNFPTNAMLQLVVSLYLFMVYAENIKYIHGIE